MDANAWLESVFFIADKLSRPTLNNLNASFEQYQSRSGLGRAIARWERVGWLKRERTARDGPEPGGTVPRRAGLLGHALGWAVARLSV
jgi:hypothetical protein